MAWCSQGAARDATWPEGVSGFAVGAALCVVGAATGALFSGVAPAATAAGVVAIAGAVIFLRTTISHPALMTGVGVLSLILLPSYVSAPGIGVSASALFVAALVATILGARVLSPGAPRAMTDEKLLGGALGFYALVVTQSLANQLVDGEALSMWAKTLALPLAFSMVVLTAIRTEDHLLRLFDMVLVGAMIAGVIAVYEFVTTDNLIIQFIQPQVTVEEDFFIWLLVNADRDLLPEDTIYRVYSTFTQPLVYAAFMTMIFSYPALRFAMEDRGSTRLLYGIAAVIVGIGMLMSFSRGPTMALILISVGLAFYAPRLRSWLLAGAGAVAMAGVLAWPWIGEQLIERIRGAKNVNMRFHLWENGLAIFAQNPVRGIGYGAYPRAHPDSINANRIGPMYDYPWQHVERVTTVESIYITLLLETGLIGFLAFFGVIATFFVLFFRIMRRRPDVRTRIMALSCVGGVVGYLLSGITVANIVDHTITTIFFSVFICGIAVLSRVPPREDGCS